VTGFDIIGDVHGCADKLEGLLKKLDFSESGGVYHHSNRTAVFVGDLIDRGPHQRRTLEIVRAMVDEGNALIVMGNHEFNALSYATTNPEIPGEFMRPHSDKNRAQHKSFVDQVQAEPGLYARSIEWFKTFPLWLELDGIRVVHACWNDDEIEILRDGIDPGAPMSTEFVIKANQKGTPEHGAVEVLLKGPELSLRKYGQPAFKDKDGHLRTEARIRWWDGEASTLRDLAEVPAGAETRSDKPYRALPEIPCPEWTRYEYHGDKPVFYGHYWRTGNPERQRDWTAKTACVDFSAVNDGPLVAYRWEGESEIRPDNYIAFQDKTPEPVNA